jgi:hypothetical protein
VGEQIATSKPPNIAGPVTARFNDGTEISGYKTKAVRSPTADRAGELSSTSIVDLSSSLENPHDTPEHVLPRL